MFRRRLLDELAASDDATDDAVLAVGACVDRRAFAAIYESLFNDVYRYCYRRLGSAERAEDAAHQIFVRALEAFARYHEEGRLRQWLFTIAHNVVVNEARLTRPTEVIDEAADIPDPAASPEVLAIRSADVWALRAAIARLPDDQRRAIEYRIAGLTAREIASEFGRSADAVKMLQQRALDRLRADLVGGHEKGGGHGT
jgi:RNA polymerase sigma-70 factor (ECF subfamily)